MPRIPSYAEAVKVLNGRTTRRLNHNTKIERRGDTAIAIKLHDTDIVTWVTTDAGDVVILDHGGWPTMVTKDRINHCLPDGWYLDGSCVSGFYLEGDIHQSPYYDRRRGREPKNWRPWVITNGRPWCEKATTITEFYPHIAIPVLEAAA